MAVLAVLLPGDPVPLAASVVRGFADLGVTRIELLGSATFSALVLEGWAFAPGTAAEAVLELLGDPPGATVLQPFARVAVDAATSTWKEAI